MCSRLSVLILFLTLCPDVLHADDPLPLTVGDNFQQQNLVAWCIVPFDANKRTPAERATMLKQLGIRRCAYDWRAEHVPTFEAEILAYQKEGIEFFAFWGVHDKAFELFEKYKLHPQIWVMLPNSLKGTQQEKVAAAVNQMLPVVKRTKAMGCNLGLYNHGGWGGEPANLVAVCERLREMGHNHVGIVYNFHHGHAHIDNWARLFASMKPYLHCLNINGMNSGAQPKILGIGKGKHELEMLREVVRSGHKGPIGILDHRSELDAAKSLQENLDGLKWIRKELTKPGSGGPPPKAKVLSQSPHRVVPGMEAYRTPPITVECRATLHRRDVYNIFVANDTKQSGEHWELFSMNGTGHLTAYLPGYQPDHVHSQAMICDGKPHTLSMRFEPTRVRLYVDETEVASQTVKATGRKPVPGGLGLGRLVEGGLQCYGELEWIRISTGIRPISLRPVVEAKKENDTLGLWTFAAKSETKTQSKAIPKELPYDPKFVKQLISEARQKGNALRGAKVFAHAKSACLSCHRVGTQGGNVGPDLSRVGKERTLSQLVESVFWPKRDVKPEYTVWKVLTSEGKVRTGYRHQSSDESLTLRELASGKLITIDRNEIEREIKGSTPMPAGLTTALTRQQQRDLIAFLARLGQPEAPDSATIETILTHAQMHGPAAFPLTEKPLSPKRWPNAGHPINRKRLYDYYTKQAEHFRQQPHTPMLLTAYPGLDGADTGHWGTQSETTWADDRWNETKLGSVQCGVFRGQNKTVTRGVCLRLGDKGELSVCFNPDTLRYEAAWSGGFVKFSSVRHGFLGGLQMNGKPEPLPAQQPIKKTFRYHGFYRHGKRVIFAYRIGDVEYLDAPWMQEGKFVREVAPIDKHSLRDSWNQSQPQWPQVIKSPIVPGTERPYATDTISLPYENPWKALMFCGGHDFLPDGSALVCTMQGDVWRVTGLDAPADRVRIADWKRFASGLHHPLGLVVSKGQIYVQCRDQLTRLTDLNNDGEADFYECFSNAFETSPAGHDFICGLQRDPAGNFYTASGNQGLVRISADGRKADVLATGFRNPDGIGLLPDGTITVPCSEGGWTPASMICAIPTQTELPKSPPLHFGFRGPINGQPPELPLGYFPRGLDNSSGGQVHVASQKFGPLSDQMVHLSFGTGTWFIVLRDEVNGRLQGAVIPMTGDFLSGAHRGRFHPKDGQLYITGMQGWGSYTPKDGCFHRVRYTGDVVQIPTKFHVHENGIHMTFSQPLDRDIAENTASHFAHCWNYHYSGAYGSPEYSPSHPGVAGHDPLVISSAHVLADGKSLFLEIPDLQPVSQLHLRMHVNQPKSHHSYNPAGSGHDLFITVHALDRPFTEFPDYHPVQKVIAAHPLLRDMALSSQRKPNPFQKPLPSARKIEIETGKNLTYATREFTVKPNEPLAFTLSNPDVVPHNWVLIQPDTLTEIGTLANQLIARPDAYARQYIPDSKHVLVYTDIVGPGQKGTVHFKAPAKPGRYPFLCTFPGHWMVMNGVMVVE